jgi:hypothetical protein
MARKSNWQRRGLNKPQTDADRQLQRRARDIERKIAQLPPELRETARRNPGLLS